MIGLKKKEKQAVVKEETFDIQKTTGFLQFQKEYPELTAPPQAKLQLNEKNIMEFKVTYSPEKDSYWYGGKYEFSIIIPADYNISAPKVHCNTRIYHPNIDLKGNVCLNILKDDWRPILNVNIVLAGLYYLFTDPNPNDPLNHDAATLMRDDLNKFIANVKKSLKGGNLFGEDFPKF